MRKIYGVVAEFLIVALFVCGCGRAPAQSQLTSEADQTEVVEEATTEPFVSTTEEAATEESTRDGSRNNPYIVGDDFDIHFYGWTIKAYGDVNVKIVKYSGGKVTLRYSLDNFGNSNPLFFSTKVRYQDGELLENNNVLYVYSCKNPGVFTTSDKIFIHPNKNVSIACGKSGKVTYKVGKQKYLAFSWDTLKEDGGDYDSLDNDYCYHLAFIDLRK
jgi:hypothetical protein